MNQPDVSVPLAGVVLDADPTASIIVETHGHTVWAVGPVETRGEAEAAVRAIRAGIAMLPPGWVIDVSKPQE